jgi:hypothetical protein
MSRLVIAGPLASAIAGLLALVLAVFAWSELPGWMTTQLFLIALAQAIRDELESLLREASDRLL